MKSGKLLWLLLACIPFFVQAQEEVPFKNVVKISPQHFAFNTLKVGLEHFSSPSKSISLYLSGRSSNQNYYSDDLNGIMAEVQFRKYLKPFQQVTGRKDRTYHQGIYLAGILQGGYFSGNVQGSDYTYNSVTGLYTYFDFEYSQKVVNGAGGFTIGVQRLLWDILYIDVFVGGGVQFADVSKKGYTATIPYYYDYATDFTDPAYKGVIPKIGVQIGLGL